MPVVTEVRGMTCSDLPLGMRLKAANGWNQTEADWRRYLELQPDGCFVAEVDRVPVGTATTCVFGSVAWIAMVLVDVAYRGRGVGKALMSRCLEYLAGQGVRTVRLDATPLGQPLYEKLGFRVDYALERFEGVVPPGSGGEALMPINTEEALEVFRLDHSVTMTDRHKLLARLLNELPDSLRGFRRAGQLEGFGGVRPGARALQFGPVIAGEAAGRPLLEDACRRHAGMRAFIDIPCTNESARRWVETIGWAIQRRLHRMSLGPQVNEVIERIWASSGPEMG